MSFTYYNPKGDQVTSVTHNIIREDGRVEELCKHGVGHPVGHIKKNGWNDSWMGVHGCCGCCLKLGGVNE